MLEAICKEVSLTERFAEEIITTLYFGGGTPSILSSDELKLIFDALHKRFAFGDDIEITLEAKDRKSTRLNSSHLRLSRMPSSA